MAVTNEFKSAVETKDVRLVRIMLKDSLVVDPTFAEFNQMMGLANTLDGLFDDHDGEALNYDAAGWTKDYMDEQMVQIVYNFSEERLDLLKKVCKHLYGRRTEATVPRQVVQQPHDSHISRRQIGTAVAITGVVTTAVGVALSEAIVIGTGIVATVVGSAIIITNK